MASYVVDCACGCGTFEAKSPRAKWAKPGCKKRAQRRAAAAEEPQGTAAGEPTAGRKPLDPLELAVRKELTEANQLTSVDGQIAVHLARQVKAATGSQAAALAKELRVVLDRVVPPKPPAPGAEGPTPAAPDDDEVTKARRRREEIAAAAAAE